MGFGNLKVIILLLFLTFIFFWKILFNPGKILYPVQDVIEQYSAWKYMIHNNFNSQKSLPLWNPYYFSGHPFVSNVLSGMFYPINSVYLFFNPDLAFSFIFMLDIFLAGVFAYFFCREIGMDLSSSLFSSLVFMFSFYFADHIFAGHLANIDAIIWMPLAFLFTELLIKRQNAVYAILLSIILSLQVFAGHIQHSFYSNIALGIYFIFRLAKIYLEEKKISKILKPFFLFIISFILFVFVSAIQLFPSFEFLFYSVRSKGLSYEEASMFSLPPYQLFGFLSPEFFGTPLDQTYWGGRNFFELSAYIGVISTVFVLIGCLFKRNHYTLVFLFLALITVLFSFGSYTFFYYFFYKYVPGFNLFRIPSTPLFIYTFSVSILSGFGFSFVFSLMSKKEKNIFLKLIKFLFFLNLVLGISIIFVYLKKDYLISVGKQIILDKYSFHSQTNRLKDIENYLSKLPLAYSHILESLLILFTLLLFSLLLLFLTVKSDRKKTFFKILVFFLLLFDLWIFWQKYLLVVDPYEIYYKPKIKETDLSDIIAVFKDDKDFFRVFDSTDWILPQYIAIRNDIYLINGYDLSKLADYNEFLEKMNFRNLSDPSSLSKGMALLNGKYMISVEEIKSEDFELVYFTNRTIKMMPRSFIAASKYEANTTYIYKNKNWLPRAYLVPQADEVGRTEIIPRLKSKSFYPQKTVLIEKNSGKEISTNCTFKKVEISFYSPNKVIIEVNTTDECYLVLSELWYPGWRAYDNGKETEILRANYILRAVYLDEGFHELKFVFFPSSLKIGFLISVSSLALISVLLIYFILKER